MGKCCNLPGNAFKVFDEIEMGVAADDGKAVLPGDGGNPEVVHGDRGAAFFEFQPEIVVVVAGAVIDGQNLCGGQCFAHPHLHGLAFGGLQHPKAKLGQGRNGNADAGQTTKTPRISGSLFHQAERALVSRIISSRPRPPVQIHLR